MIKFLTRYNFHFLLIPVFFIWHCYNEYFGLITVPYLLKYTSYYLALSLVIFVFGKLILKYNVKAAIWTFLLLTIFFFFGAFHDFIKSNALFSIISSYSILLPLIFVTIVTAAIVLKRNTNKQIRLTAYMNAVMLFLILLEVQVTIYQIVTDQKTKNNLTYGNSLPNLNIQSLPDSLKPDIYFIIFDEYANTKSLKKYLGYDNSLLDSSLIKKGFFIADNASSNYNSTPHSIASTLSLQYLDIDLEDYPYAPGITLKAQQTIDESYFPNTLASAGYKIINNSIFNCAGADSPKEPFFNFDIQKVLTYETLYSRIIKDIWWNVTLRMNTVPEIEKKQTERLLPDSKQYLSSITNTIETLKKRHTQPVFLYTHVIIPHRPFFFNKKGNPRTILLTDHIHGKTMDSLYIDQLQYCNTLIDSIASATVNIPSNRPKVVIIAGDHGYRDAELEDKIREKEFANLNAIYFSDKDYSTLYENMSSVNIFRLIANKYFKADFPLLKDSTVMLH